MAAEPVLIPAVDGEWWTIAGDPDLGKAATARQEPVDFAIWQSAGGTWQLWSCIRHTACCKAGSRLFHRWQGAKLSEPDWQPMGIAMQTDPGFGETDGWARAPHVVRAGPEFWLFCGGGSQICLARGAGGKTFARQLRPGGKSALFSEGEGTRDVMILRGGSGYHAYYTASVNKKGAVYARRSKNLRHWSASQAVSAGGSAGHGPYSAECPFVYFHQPSGYYYLFRTQRCQDPPQTSVCRSRDPLEFGVNDDRFLACRMAVAAPELVTHEGQLYLAALLPALKGIRVARLKWVERP